MNHHYNKNLKYFAQSHRNGSTKAEIRLWCELLRNKQMKDYPFLRQRPIGNYIADFYCKELKLVIETDGISHTYNDVIDKDFKKDRDLKQWGYTVLRIQDDEVFKNIENVKRKIQLVIVEIESYKIIPLPPSKGD